VKGLAHASVRLEIDGLASFELVGNGFERASARVQALEVIIQRKESLGGGDARTTEDAGDDGHEEGVASTASRRRARTRAPRLDRAPRERHCGDAVREADVYLDRATVEWNRASLCEESV